MTVLFDIRGAVWPEDEDGLRSPPPEMFLNIANTNARDFLDWLGLTEAELWGEMPARDLVPLLRRRLWPEIRHRDDIGRSSFTEQSPSGAAFIECGREPGRLARYAEKLLALAQRAGEGTIIWY